MDARKEAGWHRFRKVDEQRRRNEKRTERNRALLAALRDRNKPLAGRAHQNTAVTHGGGTTGTAFEENRERRICWSRPDDLRLSEIGGWSEDRRDRGTHVIGNLEELGSGQGID